MTGKDVESMRPGNSGLRIVTKDPSVSRLLEIAFRDTGQSKRVADFLLAWYNSEENGAWNPVDLWSVDTEIAKDMLAVLFLIASSGAYPPALGFGPEFARLWEMWRGLR